jgi:hypothetical protein
VCVPVILLEEALKGERVSVDSGVARYVDGRDICSEFEVDVCSAGLSEAFYV